jgi:hypothetical protein
MVHAYVGQNCDSDQPIPSNDSTSVLYLSSAVNPLSNMPLSINTCLSDLRRGWDSRLRRYSMTEQDYLSAYQIYLEKITSSRVELVHEWLKVNTSRFAENAEIKILFRTFEDLVKELKTAILPCGASCSTCSLLCLEQRHHEGRHDCATNHMCPKLCGFVDQHGGSVIPPCGMPSVSLQFIEIIMILIANRAGHEGRHVYASDLPDEP